MIKEYVTPICSTATGKTAQLTAEINSQPKGPVRAVGGEGVVSGGDLSTDKLTNFKRLKSKMKSSDGFRERRRD
jgi:hypothetical protein